uniref:Uncharacterized protein n=1 Tax=Myotis myotis TaxID=51298 RepID=A0A7J7Z5E1_MYOMY|nr:hypothetical protein mMyoMyo1_010665 [Myotis myotis]
MELIQPKSHKLPDFEGQAGAQGGFADPECAQCMSPVLSLEMKPTARLWALPMSAAWRGSQLSRTGAAPRRRPGVSLVRPAEQPRPMSPGVTKARAPLWLGYGCWPSLLMRFGPLFPLSMCF